MKKWIPVVWLMAFVGGCTNTDVRTDGWSLQMSRLLTDTEFDKASVRIEPNDVVTITFEKFKSEGQQMAEILEKVIPGLGQKFLRIAEQMQYFSF